MKQLPTLQGDRVQLRWIDRDDAEDLLQTWGDPDVMAYMLRAPLRDRAEAERFIDSIHDGLRTGTLFQWGITVPDEPGLIGTCTLCDITGIHHRAEIGFALARRWWGKRLMSDAVRALLDHAFTSMDLHRIVADVDPRNQASLALLKRMGFQLEGRLREHYFINSEIQDAELLGLLRSEWEAQSGAGMP